MTTTQLISQYLCVLTLLKANIIYSSKLLPNMSKDCFRFIQAALLQWDLSVEQPSKHQSALWDSPQQKKPQKTCTSNLMWMWTRSQTPIVVFLYHIMAGMGWAGLMWLYCCVGLCQRPFSACIHPTVFELPSYHSLLMSLVLFQEHIAHCHYCVTDKSSVNTVRLNCLVIVNWMS